jgi:DNA invertase Pin-like site-specific DNA recombinase
LGYYWDTSPNRIKADSKTLAYLVHLRVTQVRRFGAVESESVYLVQQKRVAIYARCSTDKQDLDYQLRILSEYADRANYQVVGIYHEYMSGAKDDRPERSKILKLAQARLIDAVLITELSRWGRSTTDLIATAQELRSRNVSLIAQSGLQFDFDSPQGKLLYSLLAGFAEFERDLIRERVRAGLTAAKLRGKQLGRKLGQSPKRIERLEDKVRQFVADGKSYRWIAKELQISKTTVARILAS